MTRGISFSDNRCEFLQFGTGAGNPRDYWEGFPTAEVWGIVWGRWEWKVGGNIQEFLKI